MQNDPNLKILTAIVTSYPGYGVMAEFAAGFEAYQRGQYRSPYNPDSVEAQAWDRGLEACMRYQRALDGLK
jgi:hypothetical protein